MTPLKRYYSLLGLDKKDVLQLFFYAIFAGLISLSLPLGIQAIINFIQAGRISASWIVLIFLVVIGVALVGILSLMQLRITENLQQKITNQQKLEKLKLFILRKKQDQEMNKLRKFTCHNCGMDIKLNQPRIANRVNGEFIGWNHVSC
jgi:ABC-type multidrug transport system fused ATPase/permease subunit